MASHSAKALGRAVLAGSSYCLASGHCAASRLGGGAARLGHADQADHGFSPLEDEDGVLGGEAEGAVRQGGQPGGLELDARGPVAEVGEQVAGLADALDRGQGDHDACGAGRPDGGFEDGAVAAADEQGVRFGQAG